MPYSGPDDPKLPMQVQAMPPGKRRRWVATWNSVYARCLRDNADAANPAAWCEAEAFRIANGVVKALDEAVDVLMDLDRVEAEVLGANPARAVVQVAAGGHRVYVEVGGDAPPQVLGLVYPDGGWAVPDGVVRDARDLPRDAVEFESQVRDYAARLARTTEVSRYAIVKREHVRRYTLGVAYPAAELDAHGDFATAEDLELAAWNYLARHRQAGVMHEDGTEGAGVVVESYIYRGPPWRVAGQEVSPGDWLLGVVWDEATWERIQRGELTGFSIQGTAVLEPSAELAEEAEEAEEAAEGGGAAGVAGAAGAAGIAGAEQEPDAAAVTDGTESRNAR